MINKRPPHIEIPHCGTKRDIPQTEGSGASPCSPARGYETFIKGTQLTMNFRTSADAVAFFNWIMENTNHKKQEEEMERLYEIAEKRSDELREEQ